jgi:hypothetical protein
MSDDIDGLVRLECKECGGVFEVLNPPYDLLMYPLCSSCQTDDKTETYPLTRGD